MTPQFDSVNPTILRPNPWNSNVVSPENERKLDESLKRLGVFKPAIVREVVTKINTARGERESYLQILGGEHRVASAIRIGINPVPVINLGVIDDQRAKEISLADNSRYGIDDTLQLAEMLKDIGSADQIAEFLPWTKTDIESMLATVTVDLDALSLTENIVADGDGGEKQTRTPKTHAVMRFKVSLGDQERIAAIIARTQKDQGFTKADDLTNAGDALVHVLLGEVDE